MSVSLGSYIKSQPFKQILPRGVEKSQQNTKSKQRRQARRRTL
nr:MAG TPA: hypothetical protein [Caudoviricetes sp.]